MDLKLKGLTALVTGGTAGIGLAVATQFAKEGCNIITCSRTATRAAKARDTLSAYGVNVRADEVDVTSSSAVSWLSSVGHIDIFVPNVSATSADWDESLATDILSTVHLTEAALPLLSNSEYAAITYVGSKAGTYATPGFEAYGATKAAVIHYMKSLSHKAAGKIRVNTVSPGDTFVAGGFWDNIRKNSPELYTSTEQSNPMKRFCTPQEVANAVTFISSPAASFINGAHLLVDGGATLHVQR